MIGPCRTARGGTFARATIVVAAASAADDDSAVVALSRAAVVAVGDAAASAVFIPRDLVLGLLFLSPTAAGDASTLSRERGLRSAHHKLVDDIYESEVYPIMISQKSSFIIRLSSTTAL